MTDDGRLDVSVNNGEYRVVLTESGKLHALRYGKPWRDLVGDNLVLSLACELQESRERIRLVIAAIETYRNTMNVGLEIIRSVGANSVEFKANADQSTAAWRDLIELIASVKK